MLSQSNSFHILKETALTNMLNKHKRCINRVVAQISSICILSSATKSLVGGPCCWVLGYHLIHRYLHTFTWLLSTETHLPPYSGGQNFHGQVCGSTWQAEHPQPWDLGQGGCLFCYVAACTTQFSLHAGPGFQH